MSYLIPLEHLIGSKHSVHCPQPLTRRPVRPLAVAFKTSRRPMGRYSRWPSVPCAGARADNCDLCPEIETPLAVFTSWAICRLRFAPCPGDGCSSCHRVTGPAPASPSHVRQGLSAASVGLRPHSIHTHCFNQRSTVAVTTYDRRKTRLTHLLQLHFPMSNITSHDLAQEKLAREAASSLQDSSNINIYRTAAATT